MDNVINILALDQEQTRWMLSLKRLKVQADVSTEKNSKKQAAKQLWMNEWSRLERTSFMNSFSVATCALAEDSAALLEMTKRLMHGGDSKTWYYLAAMEAELFDPYYPLYGEEDPKAKEKNKEFKGLKFKQDGFVAIFLAMDKQIPPTFLDRVNKCYHNAIARMDQRYSKIAIGALSTIAVSAAVAATAGLLAGPIAVSLVGGNFTLTGASLTSASLALLGGGSIAAGGAGMAGGVATIVGGGALLGLAVGGTASATATTLALATPQMALSMAAKLEVTIREVLLNAQHDTVAAQQVLTKYKEELKRLKHSIVDLEEQDKVNKKQIKALQTSVGYLTRSTQSLDKFTSAYEIGAKTGKEN